eukprot:gene27156-33838_t
MKRALDKFIAASFGKLSISEETQTVATLSELFSNFTSVPLNPLHFTQMRTPIGKKKCKKKPKKKTTVAASVGSVGSRDDCPEDEGDEIANAADAVPRADLAGEEEPQHSEIEDAPEFTHPKECDQHVGVLKESSQTAPSLSESTSVTASAVVEEQSSWSVVDRDKRSKLLNKLGQLTEQVTATAPLISEVGTKSDFIHSRSAALSPQTILKPTLLPPTQKPAAPPLQVATNKTQWTNSVESVRLMSALLTPPPPPPPLTPVEAAVSDNKPDSVPVLFTGGSVNSLDTKMVCTITQTSRLSTSVKPHCYFAPGPQHRGRYLPECDYDTAVRVMAESFVDQRGALSLASVRQSMSSRPCEMQSRLEAHRLSRDLLVSDVWERIQSDERFHAIRVGVDHGKCVPPVPALLQLKGVPEDTSKPLPGLIKVNSEMKSGEKTHNAAVSVKIGSKPHYTAPPSHYSNPPTSNLMSFYDNFSASKLAPPSPRLTSSSSSSSSSSSPYSSTSSQNAYREAITHLAGQFADSAAKMIAHSGHPYRVSNVQSTAKHPEFHSRLPPLLQQMDTQLVVRDVVEEMKRDRRLVVNGEWFHLRTEEDANNIPTGQLRTISGTATNPHFATAPGQWSLDLPVSAMKIEMGGVTTDFSVLAVGEIKTHLQGVPIDPHSTVDPKTGIYHGPFVIPGPPVAPTGLYPWVILSDSKKSQLFVLAREVSEFVDQYQQVVLQKVQSLGFTSDQTKPIEIVHPANCQHPPLPIIV